MRKPSFVLTIVWVFLLSAIPLFSQSSKLSAADVEHRVDSILNQMTLDEKIDMISGTGFATRAIPRLGVPAFQMSDGPIGSRNFGPSTAVAGGIGLAATWDPELAQREAKQIGRDARARGAVILLGPGVNIYRAPMNGRNFEYFGEDPFLASRIAVGYIEGMQSVGVGASIKHYMGNNSEYGRNTTDSVIDERTKREIYLPVFEAGVKEAHVATIMDSYNLADGEHLTQSSYLNTEVAKKEWGFNGLIMSDWGAVHDTLGPANGGLDLEMPTGQFWSRKNLQPLIDSGKVSVATIDDKVRRILRIGVEFGWMDESHVAPDIFVPRYNQQGRQASLEGAREGIVLLKNEGNLLPLSKSKIKSIAVIGPDAYPAVPTGGGSGRVNAFHAVSILEGLSDALGTSVNVYYHRGIPSLSALANGTEFSTAESNGEPGLKVETFDNAELSGAPASTRTERRVNIAGQAFGGGTFDPDDPPANGFGGFRQSQPSSNRWTGYYVAKSAGPYEVFVQSRDNFRLLIDDKSVIDNWEIPKANVTSTSISLSPGTHKVVLEQTRQRSFGQAQSRLGIVPQDSFVLPEAKELAAKADAVVVAVGFDPTTETEGSDREFALLPGQDDLIQAMAAANKNTIVVVASGGGVDTNAWIDHVPALLQTWYPGEEGGTALTDVLLGNVNPSGHLPITWEKHLEDNPAYANYYPQPGTNKIVYKEGIFVGYRGYEHNGTKPLFPFGFGLSYTTFKYSNLSIKPTAGSGNGSSSLYEVTFDVTNTGKRAGADVAQVYVGEEQAKVPRPAKELKGFQRVDLRPGETRKVTIPLNARAFTYYDVDGKQWHADADNFNILVGRSVEDIQLQGKVKLSSAIDLDVSR
jgi:beta-glucosidase